MIEQHIKHKYLLLVFVPEVIVRQEGNAKEPHFTFHDINHKREKTVHSFNAVLSASTAKNRASSKSSTSQFLCGHKFMRAVGMREPPSSHCCTNDLVKVSIVCTTFTRCASSSIPSKMPLRLWSWEIVSSSRSSHVSSMKNWQPSSRSDGRNCSILLSCRCLSHTKYACCRFLASLCIVFQYDDEWRDLSCSHKCLSPDKFIYVFTHNLSCSCSRICLFLISYLNRLFLSHPLSASLHYHHITTPTCVTFTFSLKEESNASVNELFFSRIFCHKQLMSHTQNTTTTYWCK